MKPRNQAELIDLFKRCRNDFDLFNVEVLGRPPCWSRQIEIAESVATRRDTVVCSGNATGKTWLAAGIILWYLYTRPRSLVVVTGPGQTSLGSTIFKEIRRALAGAVIDLGGKISTSPGASPQLFEVVPGSGWEAMGISTNSVERLSGRHAKNLLVVVDEASGVDEEIYQAIDSLNYDRMLAIGNPIRPDGRFHDLWRQAERERDRTDIPDQSKINAIRVASTDGPHAAIERSPYGLADAGWLESMRRRYGEESQWWNVHVRALFPDTIADGLIPVEWLDAATSFRRDEASRQDPLAGPRRIACDLGEGVGRDRSVIVVRDDRGILEVVAGDRIGLEEAAYHIYILAQTYHVNEQFISYDASGIGRDMRGRLERRGIRRARAYHGSASGGKNFYNLRTAAAWNLRSRLDPAVDPARTPFHIPYQTWWPDAREELVALRFEVIQGATKLENKDLLAARLGRSPDFADAIIQSFSY